MSTPANPPAFPRPSFHVRDSEQMTVRDTNPNDGMTLRDYFAAKAMVGIFASPKNIGSNTILTEKDVAKAAYVMADAMLAERAKTL